MEVRIGIKDSPRELTFETNADAGDVRKSVEDAISSNAPLITFTDAKGSEYLIATQSFSYIELGGENARRVGFVS